MLESAQSFLDYRKKQELLIDSKRKGENLFDAVLTVEINITDLCNRMCSFCPRVNPEIYPNKNVFIHQLTLNKITEELNRLSYKGKVSFSGFGEPLLNKNFVTIVRQFRRELNSEVIIETNTNGDKLTKSLLSEIFDAGLSSLYWNLYDGPEQLETVNSIIKESGVPNNKIRIRPHWSDAAFFNEVGLFLNNRSGALETDSMTELPLKKPCNYPFYKMLIDWNGDVLICSNDWMRKKIIANVMNIPLDQIWADSNWNIYRKSLINGNRSIEPCKTCDIDGGLFGEKSVDIFKSLLQI